MNKESILFAVLMCSMVRPLCGMYAVAKYAGRVRPQSTLKVLSKHCCDKTEEQGIDRTSKTKSIEKMYPYLSQLGKSSEILKIANTPEFKRYVDADCSISKLTSKRTSRPSLIAAKYRKKYLDVSINKEGLDTLENRLARAHTDGHKVFTSRIDFCENVVKNNQHISLRNLWEQFGILTIPTLAIMGAALGYQIDGGIGMGLGALCGCNWFTLGALSILYSSADAKQSAYLIMRLLTDKPRSIQYKEMEKFFELADRLYEEGKANKRKKTHLYRNFGE